MKSGNKLEAGKAKAHIPKQNPISEAKSSATKSPTLLRPADAQASMGSSCRALRDGRLPSRTLRNENTIMIPFV